MVVKASVHPTQSQSHFQPLHTHVPIPTTLCGSISSLVGLYMRTCTSSSACSTGCQSCPSLRVSAHSLRYGEMPSFSIVASSSFSGWSFTCEREADR